MHPTGSVVFMAEKTSGCFVCLLAYLWFQLMDVVVFQVCAGILWGCQEDRYRMRTFLLLVSGLNPQLQDTAGRYLSTNSYIRVSWHVYPDNECVCICVGGLSCKVPVPVYLQLTTDWGISSNLQPHDCVSVCVSALELGWPSVSIRIMM